MRNLYFHIHWQPTKHIVEFSIKFLGNFTQQAEAVFNKIADPRNKNYPGLISMLQGFQKCIA